MVNFYRICKVHRQPGGSIHRPKLTLPRFNKELNLLFCGDLWSCWIIDDTWLLTWSPARPANGRALHPAVIKTIFSESQPSSVSHSAYGRLGPTKMSCALIVLNSPNISSRQFSTAPWLPNQSPSCLHRVAINASQWVMPLNQRARSWTLPYSLPLIIGPARSSESGKSHRRPGLIGAALPRPCWENLPLHGLSSNRRPPLLPVAFNGGHFVQGVSAYFVFFFRLAL